MKIVFAVITGFVLLNSGFALASSDSNTGYTYASESVISHSGRTNKDGCHNDRKRGTYHCH